MSTNNGSALSIYRGDTFSELILIATTQSDGSFLGVDLTPYGTVWTAQLRKSEDDTDSIAFDVDTSLANLGKITISLTPTVTAALPNKGVWDLQVENTATTPHVVKTFVKGTFTLVKDVTRA